MDPERYNRVLNKLRQAHTQTEEEQTTARTRSGWWLPAAAALVIAVATGIWLYVKHTPTETLAQQQPSTFTFKDKQLVKLPDGSTVVLNAGSELTYTSDFAVATRQVTLKGEGFFDVAHDPRHPFIVKAGTLTTTVLGTAFNINTTDSKTVVTVTRGRVEVADTQGHYQTLTPNQQVVAVTATDNTLQKQDITATTATQWMDEFLILDDVTIDEAARILSSKYHKKFVVANKAAGSCRIHATFFNNESLETVMALLGSLMHLEYQQGGDTITITNAGC
jgi:ferric-dicitrate binding protein FerR (iron transport regulator)